METRLAFLGFNSACSRLVQGLYESREVKLVGILAEEIPPEWPPSLEPPPLFSSRKELLRTAAPDLLMVAKKTGELKGIPAKCQVIKVEEGSAAARLLEAIPMPDDIDTFSEEDVREIASICGSVNVIEAYSDPVPKLAQLLDRAMAISGAELGMVLMPEDVFDELRVVLARGEGAKHLVSKGLSTVKSVSGKAFDSGEVVQAVLQPEMEEFGYLESTGVQSIMALPLRAEGRVVGVFSLGREDDRFDILRTPLLTLVSDQGGLAVLIARLYSELETNVVSDPASGLFNLHYFQHQVNQEVNRARRYSLNVCLVFLEIDDYQGYIERNGRYMGDFILSDMGNIIKRNTREVDTAARYGDNLFAILLPETRRLGAMRLAERIRKVMEEYPFPSREKKEVEKLTTCIGISSFPANADNEQDLVERALAALTAAKSEGANNIVLYSENASEETA